MGRRAVSLLLLGAGVLCAIIFALLNLAGAVGTRLDTLMLYAGIIAIAAGLVVFATSSSTVGKKEEG